MLASVAVPWARRCSAGGGVQPRLLDAQRACCAMLAQCASKAEQGARRAGDGSAGNALLHADEDGAGMGALPQREADLLPLWLGVQRAAPGAARAAARAELAAALDARRVRAAAAHSTVFVE